MLQVIIWRTWLLLLVGALSPYHKFYNYYFQFPSVQGDLHLIKLYILSNRAASFSTSLDNRDILPGNYANSVAYQNQSLVSPYSGYYASGRGLLTNHEGVQVLKRNRSPPLPSGSEVPLEDSHFSVKEFRRYSTWISFDFHNPCALFVVFVPFSSLGQLSNGDNGKQCLCTSIPICVCEWYFDQKIPLISIHITNDKRKKTWPELSLNKIMKGVL